MNSFFRRLPLPFKLMLLGLTPLGFIVYLSSRLYQEKSQKLALLNNYIEGVGRSADLTGLIDHLQQERQYSYEYVLKKISKSDMLAQRPAVDSIIGKIESAADTTLKRFSDYSFLKNLKDTRKRIDSGSIDANGVMHFYSSTIFRLNTLSGILPSNNVYLASVYNDLAAQKLLSEMVTYSGIIHANVFNLLYTRQYIIETLMGTYPSYEVLNSYEVEFLQKASPATEQAYKYIRNSSLKPTADYLDKLFRTFKLDTSYDSKEWGKLSERGINDLRHLQIGLLQNVRQKLNAVYDGERKSQTRTLVFLILVLLIVVGIVAYTIYVINSMLHEIKLAALKIAKGESGAQFKNIPSDVIGSLAQSISKIDSTHKDLARAAELIGHGNFDVPLEPRSANDVLTNALQQMKDNLQHSARETETSREQFRKLADFVPQMVWTAEPSGHLDYYNKQWYEYTGFKEGYGDQSWIPILHPDDVKKCVDAWYSSVRTGKPYEIEYRFKDKVSGGYRWFLGRAVPVRNTEGEIVKWFGTCTDIHERKTMSENLESLVKERTEQLERSNDDLQQFAHVASHDLKEPLRKIRIFSNRLKEEFQGSIPDKGKNYVDKIQLAAQRMSAMIEGVLNYSLATNTEENLECIELNGIIGEVEQDLELMIQQKHASITQAELPEVRGIRVLIHQLFYNLLNNALKFSREGEKNLIRITARTPDLSEIKDHGLQPGRLYTAIEIKDQGIGFDASQSEKMFQIFTRLNEKDRYEGTGLGLALCRKIVQRHHGTIWASGTENEGACFTVVLPLG